MKTKCIRRHFWRELEANGYPLRVNASGGPNCRTEVEFTILPDGPSATIFLRELQRTVAEEFEGQFCVRTRGGMNIACFYFNDLLDLVAELEDSEEDLWVNPERARPPERDPVPPVLDPELGRPGGLSEAGNRAYDLILEFVIANGLTYTGGARVFYSPAEWAAREETRLAATAVLIVTHDGGSPGDAFSYDRGNYELIDRLRATLERAGLHAEQSTSWYSVIYEDA